MIHKKESLSQDSLIFEEGRAFLQYVTGKKPSDVLVVRYKDVVTKLTNGSSIRIPRYLILFPFLISIFERNLFKFKDPSKELNKRLNIAFMIAEASTEFVDGFMLLENKKKIFVYSNLSFLIINELMLHLLRLFLRKPLTLIANKRFRNSI